MKLGFSKKQSQPRVKHQRRLLPSVRHILEIPAVPRFVGYARVSTPEQRLDMQLERLIAAGVDRENDLFWDKTSATNARRPYFALMKKHIQRGDTLLVYAVSRLFRDSEKLMAFFAEMKAKGVEIKSLTEALDLKTSHGRMIARMQAAVDQYEREKVRDRTVDGMATSKAKGQFMGRPRKVDDAKATKMKAMRKAGIPAAKIAKRFGVSPAAVYQYT